MNTISDKSLGMRETALMPGMPKEGEKKTKRPKFPNMRDSIASTYNAIRGTQLKGKNLKAQKLSEEQAVFAAAYNRISRLNVQTGRKFLWSVRSSWKKLREEKGQHALFKAVDKGVEKLVEAGKLTAQRGEAVLRYAVGRGNLAGRIEVLRHGRVPRLPSASRERTYIGQVIERMLNGRNATQQEMSTLRAHVYGSVNSPGEPVSSVEEAKPADLPSVKDIETLPSDMAWYPESRDTGKAILLVPDGYADGVDAVEMYDSAGNMVEELDGAWKAPDGRRQFRAEMTGAELGSGLLLLLRFTDGTILEEYLGDGSEFAKWGYCF